jgi:endonuclease/exonuclease/phosphatase family metal-dependent hydrolase
MMQRFSLYVALLCLTSIAVLAQDPITIADAKKLDFGATVSKIAGRVTSSIELSNVVYMQDRTGGIAVFNENMRLGVKIGDSVIVESGTLAEFGNTTGAPGTGLTQLTGNALRFTVVPGARVEPAARSISIPLIGEGVEGQLVRIRRLKMIESGRFEGNRSYNAMDNSGNDIVIRIDRACEIGVNNLEIPTGEIDVIGVVSQFRGTYQLLPRLAQDVGLPPIVADTVSKNRTIDITTWNLEWFGWADSTRGPFNKDLQRQRVRTIMDTIKADIYALQEVLTDEALASLSDSIVGGYRRIFNSDIPSDQKMAYIYNPSTVTPVSTGLAVNGGSQAWANGRFPLRMTFDIAGGKRMVVFNIHAKATDSATAQNDYQRRKTDAETFHAYLRDFYNDSSVVVLGDFNDRLVGTNIDSTLPSCYGVFTNDTQGWKATTLPLEQEGLSSYLGFNRSFIDHIIINRNLVPVYYRAYLESPERYLTSYSSTVSDHRPVTLRLWSDGTVGVNEQNVLSASAVRVSPNPMSTSGMVEVVAEEGGTLSVDLFTTSGEQINVVSETLAPSIRLVSLPVDQLATGSYTLVVRLNGAVSTSRVVVTR